MTTSTLTAASQTSSPAHLDVQLLYLALEGCSRCTQTDATLDEATALVRPVLDAIGVSMTVTKTRIISETEACAHAFMSSPTIRVNGRDIAGVLVESACDDCSDTCGCDSQTLCRDWLYRGQRHTAPPVGLIVEEILSGVAGSPGSGDESTMRDVPDNLRRVFAAKASVPPIVTEAPVSAKTRCSPAEQRDCCEPAAKDACCGPAATAGGGCGCR